MKLRVEFDRSLLKRVLVFLFSDNKGQDFGGTATGRFLAKIPSLSQAYYLIPLATFLLWYEKPLESLWMPLGNDFIPFVMLLISFLFSPKDNLKIKKYHYWFLLFLTSSFLAGIVGAVRNYGGSEIIWGLAVFLQLGLTLVLGELWVGKRRLKIDVLLLSLPLLAFGVWEFIRGEGVGKYSYLETAGLRIGSIVDNPNIYGFIVVIVGLVLWNLLRERKNKGWWLLYLPLISLLILTGSRTAWFASALAAIIIVVSYNWRFVLASPVGLLVLLIPRVRERILVIFTRDYIFDSSIDGRLWSLKNALHIWGQNILGTGPGTYGGRVAEINASPVYLQSMQNGYTALYTTDNQWLAILVQTGVLGILAFLGLLVSIMARFILRKNAFGLALLAALLVMMTFSNALEFGSVVVPVGILLGRELAMTNDQ